MILTLKASKTMESMGEPRLAPSWNEMWFTYYVYVYYIYIHIAPAQKIDKSFITIFTEKLNFYLCGVV